MENLEEFKTLGLNDTLLAALEKKGYTAPTPIQKLTIPLLLQETTDLIAQAQTGTGKTAAFALPLLQKILPGSGKVQALVLSPTRELCMQIASEMESMKGETGLRITAVYGGQPIGIQLSRLKWGSDIVIGTPGRVMDLMDRDVLHLDNLRFAVLDEADEMLDMGFREDMEAILSKAAPERQTLLFSATMPEEILAIAERFMKEYKILRAEQEKIDPDRTEQIFYEVHRDSKPEALARILDMNPDMYAMIFCKTRSDVNDLADYLMQRGYPVDALHGEIVQSQRTRVIQSFKEKNFRLLIATDVAARGIDVNDLTHVINYSIPQSSDAYVHRIGRTGRAGKNGVAITFITPSEFRTLVRIRRESGAKIEKGLLPGGKEMIEAKKNRISERMLAMIDTGIEPYLSFAEELLSTADRPAEALAAFLKVNYPEGFAPEDYPDLNVRHDAPKRRPRMENPDGEREHFNRKRGPYTGKNDSRGSVHPPKNFHRRDRGKPFREKDFDVSKAQAHFRPKGKKNA